MLISVQRFVGIVILNVLRTSWLRAQREKRRTIWAHKTLFPDVLFPINLNKVIFVDADQIVRADLKELVVSMYHMHTLL
jgi:hypothetical protein